MTAARPKSQPIAAVRRFNRFYTRQIGVLRKGYLDSPYSLGELRVLYEIAHGDRLTASDIGPRARSRRPAISSRVLRNFEKRGLVSRTASASDARQSHLTMTARGAKTFAPMERRSQSQAGDMLAHLTPAQQARRVATIAEIETLLADDAEPKTTAKSSYVLRQPRHGDFGWIVSRHAELYAQEYGWGDPFEGLCAQIVADFVNNFDAKHERCWIAEMNGDNVGTVMLVKDKKPGVARVRLLLVDPKARGLKLGARLVDECVRFARKAGYKKITLWTHSVLIAARRAPMKAPVSPSPRAKKRKSWGKNVVAEYWDLTL